MSFTIWFTGLPCSGKTTLSQCLYRLLQQRNLQAHLLDGDAIRAELSRPLSFSRRDRDHHGRRLGALALDLNKRGIITIVAAIAPYAETREYNRWLLNNYVEVFCCCPLEVAESRDERGLYAQARSGRIPQFTGISDPYEKPKDPEVVVYTDQEEVEASLGKIVEYLEKRGLISLAQDIPGKQKVAQLEPRPL